MNLNNSIKKLFNHWGLIQQNKPNYLPTLWRRFRFLSLNLRESRDQDEMYKDFQEILIDLLVIIFFILTFVFLTEEDDDAEYDNLK